MEKILRMEGAETKGSCPNGSLIPGAEAACFKEPAQTNKILPNRSPQWGCPAQGDLAFLSLVVLRQEPSSALPYS